MPGEVKPQTPRRRRPTSPSRQLAAATTPLPTPVVRSSVVPELRRRFRPRSLAPKKRLPPASPNPPPHQPPTPQRLLGPTSPRRSRGTCVALREVLPIAVSTVRRAARRPTSTSGCLPAAPLPPSRFPNLTPDWASMRAAGRRAQLQPQREVQQRVHDSICLPAYRGRRAGCGRSGSVPRYHNQSTIPLQPISFLRQQASIEFNHEITSSKH
ncbi:unnamed protein product [Urochloa humidicola]